MNNNFEIQKSINNYQAIIRELIKKSNNTFELNPEVLAYKEKILKLQNECSHCNDQFELALNNGRCIYCGKVMK